MSKMSPALTKEEKEIWMQEWAKITEKLKRVRVDFSKVKITCVEKGKEGQ